jgi:fructose-1-phosphate kinase PfkB-like protein
VSAPVATTTPRPRPDATRILLGLLGGRSLPAAVRLGVAAGTATCMQHGTEVCAPDDVERLDAELARQGY